MKIETSDFKRLIGTWRTEGLILTDKNNVRLDGTDCYEFILDGNYILHKADVMMGDERSETLETIQLDSSEHKAKMQYFNSKGESGVMTSLLSGNDLKIDGTGIKFRGTINNENTEITGKWYLQTEINWTDFIELKLTKQK
jgi:hypothetical protein